jgi:hypothetical protein
MAYFIVVRAPIGAGKMLTLRRSTLTVAVADEVK